MSDLLNIIINGSIEKSKTSRKRIRDEIRDLPVFDNTRRRLENAIQNGNRRISLCSIGFRENLTATCFAENNCDNSKCRKLFKKLDCS